MHSAFSLSSGLREGPISGTLIGSGLLSEKLSSTLSMNTKIYAQHCHLLTIEPIL